MDKNNFFFSFGKGSTIDKIATLMALFSHNNNLTIKRSDFYDSIGFYGFYMLRGEFVRRCILSIAN
jgi:hypothetical protein